MRFIVIGSNTTCLPKQQARQAKSALLATNHSHYHGAKLKVSATAETDFEVFGGCNRLSF